MASYSPPVTPPNKTKAWVSAFRLRTLPLALSSIGMGSFLAAVQGNFNWVVVLLCALTTVLLQVLSNLANDYGDSQHGADSQHREGPLRAVQAGSITAAEMKKGMYVTAFLSLLSGILLLYIAFGAHGLYLFLTFLALGLVCIWAAVSYTAGGNPYGYAGFGDLAVFIFFGLVGVLGTFFLQTQTFLPGMLLPAASLGFFSTGVLNINNIRDIRSDELAGKRSIPVRLGPKRARIYHCLLLSGGFLCAIIYVLQHYQSAWQFLFLLTVPLFFWNGSRVYQLQQPSQLDPYLKQMALSTMLFVLLFGIGQLIGI
ncbi:1,4-dihydroxy-2-naphthoate polyprenyltransferase [Adhaeribacter radiodurans]|uniref:1,4-dihydroxy-2-naphthoate octaprenyltransferase n=1 Tax=Adhaeribacter radiodurans TaxID=2745197 RepID=A0A7L7LD66_9BACT|nr:1,4-dihydroxy-2-naphthoate polyprenyltransferase [Adhaeribacter radiodurans]QMU30339.1 1,4-dihydroxy-2-naphthoate polyprenyltransferase [Adhaeribacter radiodurans]